MRSHVILSFDLGRRSARLTPHGPLPPPTYSPIRDAGDESLSALSLAKRQHGVAAKPAEGPRRRAENAAPLARFPYAAAPSRC
jgi:hypothetical protein